MSLHEAPTCLMLLLNDIVHDGRVRNEARALAEAGWRVLLLCNRQHPGPQSYPLPVAVEVHRLRLITERVRVAGGSPSRRVAVPLMTRIRFPGPKWIGDGLRGLEFACRVMALTWGRRVQVVHAHDLRTLPLGVFLARRMRARLLYDSHELFPEMTGRGRVGKALWRWVEARLAPQADAVLAVSEPAAVELGQRYGLGRVEVVRNLPAAPPWDGTAASGSIPSGGPGPLPPPPPTLVHVGGLGLGRGLETLAGALAICRSRPSLLLVGAAPQDFERLRACLLRLGGETSRLRWVPPVAPEALAGPLEEGSLGVVSLERVSLNNCLALPNKLFLYLAWGLPVVASDLPAIADVVRSYGVGELFEPGSPASLARAVDRLLLDPLRWWTARRAAVRAREELVWEKEAPRLLRVYRELAEPAAGAAWGRGG